MTRPAAPIRRAEKEDASRVADGSSLLALAQRRRDALALWTFEANAHARRFYEARGFRRDGAASRENEECAPALCYRWTRSTAG